MVELAFWQRLNFLTIGFPAEVGVFMVMANPQVQEQHRQQVEVEAGADDLVEDTLGVRETV